MKRKSRGQSLVEFALIFPFIILLLFATIDFGYYIYGWSSTQYAARRGAEEASKMQPREVRTAAGYHATGYPASDPCYLRIIEEASRNGSFSVATAIEPDRVFITYHTNGADATARTGDKSVQGQGRVVQVRVNKNIEPLTPIADWLMGGRDFDFNSISRRTIVANGPLITKVGEDGANYRTCTFQ